MKKIWNKLFGKKTDSLYELVETKIDEEHYRQGIRINLGKYAGVVVTTSPKIEIKEENDLLKVIFDYNVEYHPNNIQIDHQELRQIVGDCIVDIIQKDFHAPRATDTEHID
jgi:hypothetical protein